ncbi:MAG: alkaline phosphatase family protein, partial [Candidatus Micrarchaeales archaeon]
MSLKTFVIANKLLIVIAAAIVAAGAVTTGYLFQPHTVTTTTTTIIKGTTTTTITTTTIPPSTTPIKHVIIIFQENHAFDNYFGTFPNVTGIPSGECMPINTANMLKGCITPWLNTNAVDAGAGHSWQTSHTAYHNGAMNGFIMAATGDKTHNYSVMSYYNNQTIPYYWDLAHHYVLDDQMFSSVLSYSQPNHWYEIAGQAPNISLYEGVCGNVGPNPKYKCEYNKANTADPVTPTGQEYLNEANNITTLADTLQAKGINWKYYGAIAESCTSCLKTLPTTYQQST